MDLTREALEFIQGMGGPSLVECEGEYYTDKSLTRIPKFKYPEELRVSTLSSMLDYIESNLDSLREDAGRFIIHVSSPTTVKLISELDNDMKRRQIMIAQAVLPDIYIGQYIEREQFQIQLASCFENAEELNTDNALLLNLISNVQAGTISSYSDSGMSQKATIIKGILNEKQDVKIPNPVTLAPYRTFIDIMQPASAFIFRMKDRECGDNEKAIYCGLWEADGGAWKIQAVNNIKEYFRNELNDDILEDFVIIG